MNWKQGSIVVSLTCLGLVGIGSALHDLRYTRVAVDTEALASMPKMRAVLERGERARAPERPGRVDFGDWLADVEVQSSHDRNLHWNTQEPTEAQRALFLAPRANPLWYELWDDYPEWNAQDELRDLLRDATRHDAELPLARLYQSLVVQRRESYGPLADQAAELGPPDWRRILDDYATDQWIEFSITTIRNITGHLRDRVVLAVLEGRPLEAASDLEALVTLAERMEAAPWIHVQQCWSEWITTLSESVAWLAPYLDPRAAAELLVRLEAIDPLESFRIAMDAEGARVGELFRYYGRLKAQDPSGVFELDGRIASRAIEHDQNEFLHLFTRLTDTMRPGRWNFFVPIVNTSREDLDARWAPVSVKVAHWLGRTMARLPEVQTQLSLAKAALMSRSEGVEVARAWLAETPDDIRADSGTLASRVEDDGTLVMWGLGDDRQDDGGVRMRWNGDLVLTILPAVELPDYEREPELEETEEE